MYSRVPLLKKKIYLEKFRYKVQLISIFQLSFGFATLLFMTLRSSFNLYLHCGATSGLTVFLSFLSTMSAICTVTCWGINACILDGIQRKLELADQQLFKHPSSRQDAGFKSAPCSTAVVVCSRAGYLNFSAASLMCFSRLLSMTFLFLYKTPLTKSSFCGFQINPCLLLEILSCCLYVTSVVVASAVYFWGRKYRRERSGFFSVNPVDYQLRKFTLFLLGMGILSGELLLRVTDLFGVSAFTFPVCNALATLGLSIFAMGNFYGLCITDKKLNILEHELQNEASRPNLYVEPMSKFLTYHTR